MKCEAFALTACIIALGASSLMRMCAQKMEQELIFDAEKEGKGLVKIGNEDRTGIFMSLVDVDIIDDTNAA
jgi:hypothetical protein